MTRTTMTLDQLRSELATVDRIGELYLCKSGPFSGGLGIDLLSEPSIDQSAMTVRMPISTQQLDRVNHVVVQAGMRLDEYKDNPVVLFGHGCEGITFPVARSESPNGILSIVTEGETTYATAYHSAKQELSTQIFGLVVDKFLRAASVGITPLVVSKGYTSRSDEVLFIEECVLTEWSYVTVPCNPGAVLSFNNSNLVKEFLSLQRQSASRILNRGTIDGSALMPAIKKSLKSVLTTKASSPGMSTESAPSSSVVVQAIHYALTQAIFDGATAIAPVTDFEVRESVLELLSEARSIRDSLESLYQSNFDEAIVTEEDPLQEETVKSYFATDFMGLMALKAFQKRLETLTSEATKGRLNPAMLKMLSQTAKELSALGAKAEAHKPDTDKIRDEIRSEISGQYKSAVETVVRKFASLVEGNTMSPQMCELGNELLQFQKQLEYPEVVQGNRLLKLLSAFVSIVDDLDGLGVDATEPRTTLSGCLKELDSILLKCSVEDRDPHRKERIKNVRTNVQRQIAINQPCIAERKEIKLFSKMIQVTEDVARLLAIRLADKSVEAEAINDIRSVLKANLTGYRKRLNELCHGPIAIRSSADSLSERCSKLLQSEIVGARC